MREMTKRDEIKATLRQNTKDAFKAIKREAVNSNREFTARELAEMTEGRLSTQTISSFFTKNSSSFITDSASGGKKWSDDIKVVRTRNQRESVKTYVNIEDPNDYFRIKKTEMTYNIKEIIIR